MTDWFEPSPHHSRTVGALVRETFRLYRRYFRKIMLLSLCIYIPYLIVSSIFNVNSQSAFTGLLSQGPSQAAISEQLAKSLPAFVMAVVFAVISSLFVAPLLYGSILRIHVGQSTGTETPSTRQAFKHAWRRIWVVMGTEGLRWLFYIAAVGACTGVIALVAVLFEAIGLDAPAVAVAVVILSFTALWGLIWLAIKLMFTQSVVFEEHLAFTEAIRGSFRVSRGKMGRAIVFMFIILLITLVISMAIAAITSLTTSSVVAEVVSDIAEFFLTPFEFLAIAILYVDFRS